MSEHKEWEKITTSVERLEVPGGWIYEITSSDTETNIVFVPYDNGWMLSQIAHRLMQIDLTLREIHSLPSTGATDDY